MLRIVRKFLKLRAYRTRLDLQNSSASQKIATENDRHVIDSWSSKHCSATSLSHSTR